MKDETRAALRASDGHAVTDESERKKRQMPQAQLVDAYKFWRQHKRAAQGALHNAREDVASNRKRYPRSNFGMRGGADWKLGSDTVFFCEDTATYLRNERDALSVIAANSYLRPRHTGYYLSPDDCTGEIAKGVVFQLPGKDHKPRYISGIADTWSGAKNAAIISLELFDDETEAARNADAMAEIYAERERDYQEAWQAGQHYTELGDEITSARSHILALCGERRAAKHLGDAFAETCALIARDVKRSYQGIIDAREKRGELLSQYGQCDAFKESMEG